MNHSGSIGLGPKGLFLSAAIFALLPSSLALCIICAPALASDLVPTARPAATAFCVCISALGEWAGLDAPSLNAALVVEGRKAGIQLRVVIAERAGACPGSSTHNSVRISADDEGALLQTSEEDRWERVALGALHPLDRAPEVARRAIAWHQEASGEPAEQVIDLRHAIMLPPEPAESSSGLGIYVWTGGGVGAEVTGGSARGTVDMEVGLEGFAGQLAGGLRGRWMPPHNASIETVTAEVAQGELMALVKGGGEVGPVLLRAGAGAGWSRRTLNAQPAARFEPVERTLDRLVLAVETEAQLPLGAGFFVTLALSARFFVGGGDSLWQAEAVDSAPWSHWGGLAGLGWRWQAW